MPDLSFISNPFLPWNWPSDISNATISQIELVIEGLFIGFLNTTLGIINSILWAISLAIGGVLFSIVLGASSLGPFGLPMFVGFLIVVSGISMDLFHFVHDLPIVGDFV